VSTAKEDTISKLVDQVIDTAYNTTVEKGDLPNVRWGRIDYFNVTTVTTKWALWQCVLVSFPCVRFRATSDDAFVLFSAPYLVVLKDRGRTLRFYRPQNLRLNADALRTFLERDEYVMTPPWISPYAPGGPKYVSFFSVRTTANTLITSIFSEWMLDYLALVLTKVYNVVVIIPRWLLYLSSGGIASLLIGFLHRNSAKAPPAATAAPKKAETVNFDIKTEIPAPVPESPAKPTTPATPQSAKKKKAKGKSGK
jgi:hypothetical protein